MLGFGGCVLVHYLKFYQVYSALKDWKTGYKEVLDFQCSTLTKEYEKHVKYLEAFCTNWPGKFHTIMHKLYALTSYISTSVCMILG
jgi:hypothetical protein